MKSLLLISTLLFTLSSHAILDDSAFGGMTISPIEGADLVCSDKDEYGDDIAAFFFDIDGKKAWQTDSTEDVEGIDLRVEKLSLYRCPNCYSIETSLNFGEYGKAVFNFEIRQNGMNGPIKAQLVSTTPDDDEPLELELNCERVSTKAN